MESNNNHYILANQNIIPDLNILEYLNNQRKNKLNLVFYKLADGNRLEIERNEILKLLEKATEFLLIMPMSMMDSIPNIQEKGFLKLKIAFYLKL